MISTKSYVWSLKLLLVQGNNSMLHGAILDESNGTIRCIKLRTYTYMWVTSGYCPSDGASGRARKPCHHRFRVLLQKSKNFNVNSYLCTLCKFYAHLCTLMLYLSSSGRSLWFEKYLWYLGPSGPPPLVKKNIPTHLFSSLSCLLIYFHVRKPIGVPVKMLLVVVINDMQIKWWT